MSKILIIDDEATICWTLERALTSEGHQVKTAGDANAGMLLLEQQTFDLLLLDVRLPGKDGLTLLLELKEKYPKMPVVIMSAFGDLATTIKAINRGAYEYLLKPFDLDTMYDVIHSALRPAKVSRVIERITNVSGDYATLLGKTPAMQGVFRQIALVADKHVPVLITGESGTGKELVAHAIHKYSSRSKDPFVPICVPAMQDTLIESELFGHVKGSFTGAIQERTGLLVEAATGTAFFDEIGDIPLPIQVKLLRTLETKSVLPVGGNQSISTDFRLVAATNQPLEEMLGKGTFREDLYYRLNVFRIDLLPLRERPDDILLLAEHFLAQNPYLMVSHLALDFEEELLNRPWFGNVRELRNALEHAVIQARGGVIHARHLPPAVQHHQVGYAEVKLQDQIRDWFSQQLDQLKGEKAGNIYEKLLAEIEPVLIHEALKQTNGNRTDAADLLGMHRQTLRDKLKKYQEE